MILPVKSTRNSERQPCPVSEGSFSSGPTCSLFFILSAMYTLQSFSLSFDIPDQILFNPSFVPPNCISAQMFLPDHLPLLLPSLYFFFVFEFAQELLVHLWTVADIFGWSSDLGLDWEQWNLKQTRHLSNGYSAVQAMGDKFTKLCRYL